MTGFAEIFVKRERHLIVDRIDVMTVLEILDEIRKESKIFNPIAGLGIGSCNRSNENDRWFIDFDMTDKKWKVFIDKLSCDDHEIVLKKDNKFYVS